MNLLHTGNELLNPRRGQTGGSRHLVAIKTSARVHKKVGNQVNPVDVSPAVPEVCMVGQEVENVGRTGKSVLHQNAYAQHNSVEGTTSVGEESLAHYLQISGKTERAVSE